MTDEQYPSYMPSLDKLADIALEITRDHPREGSEYLHRKYWMEVYRSLLSVFEERSVTDAFDSKSGPNWERYVEAKSMLESANDPIVRKLVGIHLIRYYRNRSDPLPFHELLQILEPGTVGLWGATKIAVLRREFRALVASRMVGDE